MERRHLQQATGGGASLRNLAPPARSISGGRKPPRPTTSTPSKKQRQSFVAPLPRPSGGSLHQPSTGGGQHPLPGGGYHQSTMKAPMPSISEPSRLPSLPQVSMSSFGHAADWDTQSASSTPALDYEATVDDFSAPNLFDWTPTPDSTQDSIPPGGFVNFMTQETELEVDVLMQLQGSGSKRGGNYHHDEDIQLCRSWINITTDPITANDQPSKSYWARIAEHFHDHKCFESDRTTASLEKRMGGILKDCMRFQSFYDEIERRHPSGIPYTEHIKEAQARYARADPKTKSFTFIHCWLEVRHTEKFLSLQEAMKQSRRPSTSDKRATPAEDEGNEAGQDSTPANSSMPAAKQDRPPGRKQSKEKVKRNGRGVDECIEVWGSFVQMKVEEAKQKNERWKEATRIEQKKLEESTRLEEKRLEIKERRLMWEQEQKIMFCDLSSMDESQRAYVRVMRAQIAAAKVASLNSGASEHASGAAGDDVSSA